jgi:GTP-binding protein Era
MNEEQYQIIFLDTPGIHKPKYELQAAMYKQITLSTLDADALIYLIDNENVPISHLNIIDEELETLTSINASKKPVILVINKIDLVAKTDLLPVIELYSQRYNFQSIVPISALKELGLDELKQEFTKVLPLHPPYYDLDVLTEQPERFFIAEFIREQIFLYFREEIPYSTEVQVEEFKKRERGKHLIRATIYTERDTQKAIIIGKKGAALKTVGAEARKQIEKLIEKSIYLDLRVKVKKDWRKDNIQIKRFGY